MVPGTLRLGAGAGSPHRSFAEYIDRGTGETTAAMELTWVTVAASVVMGLAAVCVFIFSVQKDYFHNPHPRRW